MWRKLVMVVFSLLLANIGYAKDLFIAMNGDDTITYAANSISSPWLTPGKAWTEAKPGDIVYFREGNYDITEPIVTKYIGNDGTDSAPINFTSYPEESVVFTTSNITSYVFGIQRNYNHISNIDFQGSAATWFYLGEDIPANHFEIRNCKVKLGTGGDNTGFIKTSSRADYLVVEYCTVEGPGIDVHQNTSCLYVGSADYLTVKYNTFYNAPIGIYFKTDNDEDSGNEIAYNYIYNTPRNSIQTNSQFTNFHDNIIGENCGSFQINEDNGFAAGDRNTITHNTIYSGGLALNNVGDDGASYNTIRNNIICSYSTCCTDNIFDYNLYVSGTAIGGNDLGDTTPIYTATYKGDIRGYSLDSLSPGFNSASDGYDIGVIDNYAVGALAGKGVIYLGGNSQFHLDGNSTITFK